jgi:hypothetical protein
MRSPDRLNRWALVLLLLTVAAIVLFILVLVGVLR